MDVSDNILCSVIEHCICSKITIRPHHNTFLETLDWTIQLGKSLERYTTLTEGSIVPLIIDGIVQKFTIVGLYPYNHKTCILQNGNTLDVNILKSLDLVKQEPILKYLYKKEDTTSNVLAFSCIGYKLGGESIPENSTRHGVLLAAIHKRIYSKQKSSLPDTERTITQDITVEKTTPHPEIIITPDITVDTINKFFAAAAQLRKERTIRIYTAI
jgi:hypothetical protein